MKRILSCILVMVLLVSLAGCGGSKCASIVLSADEVSLPQPGQTKGLSVTKNPADAADKVSFKSSNSSVAVVDEYGLITAVGAGNATITVTCGDAVAFCEVTVGSGGINNPGINNQQGGNQTDGPGKDPTQPATQPSEPVTSDCPDCGGHGEYTCTYCNGDYQCNKCEGSGSVVVDWGNETKCYSCGGGPEGNGDCKYCGGDGCAVCDYSGICTACNTNGEMYRNQFSVWTAQCNACDGSGIFCQWCEDGVLGCKTCGGKGYVTTTCTDLAGGPNPSTSDPDKVKCSTCRDTGNCPYCDGIDMCPNENCIIGVESCQDCYGTGDCEYCYGLGYSTIGDVDCAHCNDGECRSCGGKGEWQCKTCGGTGECNYCDYGFCPACGG